MEPKISIIIPAYNAENYLKKCVESAIHQTYHNIEIICVDDGSTDHTLDILKDYEKQDMRIKVISKKNEGVSYARNSALNYITGEYVLFADSDDWLDENACQKSIDAMNEYDTDLVMWAYIREEDGVSSLKSLYNQTKVFDRDSVKTKLHRRMIGLLGDELQNPQKADILCTVWGKLYKASIIRDNNILFYDINKTGTYEDGLFNLEYLNYTNKAVFIYEFLYHYRRENRISLTNGYNENMPSQWNYLFFLMAKYIKQNDLDETYKVALYNRVSLSLIALGINVMSQEASAKKKIHDIKIIINQPKYRHAIKLLNINYLPLHWKAFFLCAKYNFSYGVFLLLVVIQKIRRR